jgi:hypothetical protein
MDPERRVDTDHMHRDIEITRASLSRTVGRLRQKAGESMRWQTYVERYPAQILVGAALTGLVVGRRIARGLRANGHRSAGGHWAPAAIDSVTRLPARLEATGERSGAVNASWERLTSRVEGLVNRVIDDVADATERALVPALLGGVQALFGLHDARPGHRSSEGNLRPDTNPSEGRRL